MATAVVSLPAPAVSMLARCVCGLVVRILVTGVGVCNCGRRFDVVVRVSGAPQREG